MKLFEAITEAMTRVAVANSVESIVTSAEGLNKNIRQFTREEIQYLTLITLYGIINYIKQGFVIKIGTCLKFISKTRDVRINLPDEKTNSRILEDRIIPKVELCKEFGRKYFMTKEM